MSKLELISVETDVKKTYKVGDKFNFKLTFDNQSLIKDDVEFKITYFGDSYSDSHDQKIGHNVIGPLPEGKQFFQLETTPIDITKIPIKTLFGLTTILIVGEYKEQQFIRIGYVVDVRYPGIETDNLVDSEDKALADIDNAEEEEIEIMDDEELSEDELVDDCCADGCCKGKGTCGGDCCDENNECACCEESDCCADKCCMGAGKCSKDCCNESKCGCYCDSEDCCITKCCEGNGICNSNNSGCCKEGQCCMEECCVDGKCCEGKGACQEQMEGCCKMDNVV